MGFARLTFVIKARDDVRGPVLYRLSTPCTPVPMCLKELPVITIDGRLAADTEAADCGGSGGWLLLLLLLWWLLLLLSLLLKLMSPLLLSVLFR